jgi:hypothetical protein
MRTKTTSVSSVLALVVSIALLLGGCSNDCETGCEGACELGNSWGVGQFCTMGGGECADTPGRMAPFCTVDVQPDGPAFCTRPCTDETQCGEDASCLGEDESGPKGCVPNFCLGD